jgi:hypothetical protein
MRLYAQRLKILLKNVHHAVMKKLFEVQCEKILSDKKMNTLIKKIF